MTLPRNPSFTPSPGLRKALEASRNRLGVTGRLNQIWDRYEHLIRSEAIRMTMAEKQVLLNVLNGSIIDPSWIAFLDQEIETSADYCDGVDAAKSLLEKVRSSSYAARLATIEAAGF